MNKSEIIAHATDSSLKITDWIKNQDDDKFDRGPDNKWTTAQVLDHLVQSDKKIRQAISFPRFILRYKFGKPNRGSRDYQSLVNRYYERMAAIDGPVRTITSTNSFTADDKESLLDEFDKSARKLIKAMMRWKDDSMDNYLVPHPAMGKLLVREMMMWASFHHLHHLEALKSNY